MPTSNPVCLSRHFMKGRPLISFPARLALGVSASVILAAVALPAHGIQIRPDRDDAEYLELATRYPSSVALDAPQGAEGVLIAPRWVLTSADRAKALRDSPRASRIRVGDDEHEIQSFFLHPEWKGAGANDVGLVLLRKGVRGVEPTVLYRANDESGKAVVIVGHGGADRRKRASINTVDRVEPRTLALRLKPLDDASDLQGAATPGDIGGPAFVEVPAGIFVAGILSTIAGEWQDYARVSAFVPWIEAVMLDVATKEMNARMDPDPR